MISVRHWHGTAVPFCLSLCLALLSSGCGDQVDGDVAAQRRKWLSAAEPTGAQPISDIKSKRSSGELKAGSEVVVRARINAGEISPWTQNQAAFLVTDATGHDGDENHDPHQCPFCRRDIRDHMALVRFRADDGKTVPMDARELLGVAEGELLVVQGTIDQADAEELVINAVRLHVVPVN